MKIECPMNSYNDLGYKIITRIARMHNYVVILMNPVVVSIN